MAKDLKNPGIFVGFKQSVKAVISDSVKEAYIARDTEDTMRASFEDLCKQHNIPVKYVDTKKELGRMADIKVGAAVVVVLNS